MGWDGLNQLTGLSLIRICATPHAATPKSATLRSRTVLARPNAKRSTGRSSRSKNEARCSPSLSRLLRSRFRSDDAQKRDAEKQTRPSPPERETLHRPQQPVQERGPLFSLAEQALTESL